MAYCLMHCYIVWCQSDLVNTKKVYFLCVITLSHEQSKTTDSGGDWRVTELFITLCTRELNQVVVSG